MPRLSRLLPSILACGVLAGGGCTARKPAPERPSYPFTDITSETGIDFHHRSGQGAGANIVETTGSGCAILDYDNDGRMDVFLVNGKNPPGDGNHLYRNLGGARFEDVSGRAKVRGLGYGVGMGVAAGDYDADGWIDIYVTNHGHNQLLRNLGNGTFEDTTVRSGTTGKGFSTAAGFADLDGDGDLDLYVCRYCYFDQSSKQLCQNRGVPTSCPPYYYTPEPDLVFRNIGGGKFVPAARQMGFNDTTGRGLGLSFVDYDEDGKVDAFVANDGTPNFLYRNLGGGRFRDVGAEEGCALNDTGSPVANMGCDFGDFMGDGHLGLTTGVFQNEVQPIWRYQPGQGFRVVTQQLGLQQLTLPLLTFGLGFADLDGDGWVDLFQVNGHVQDQIARIDKSCTYAQPRAFFRNTGTGKFVEAGSTAGPAITRPTVGRGLSFGDLDNDGDLDMLVSNSNGPPVVIRNDHPKQNWVTFRLIGKRPNWEAISARVEIEAGGRKQVSFMRTTRCYASISDPRVHFGLGSAASIARVTVVWPGGVRSVVENPPINKHCVLVQPGASLPGPLSGLAGDVVR